MLRRHASVLFFFLLALPGCVSVPGDDSVSWGNFSEGRYHMGTVLEITVPTRDGPAARQWVEAAYSDVARWEDSLSRRNPESDIARLNAAAGKESRWVDPTTAGLLSRSIEYTHLTDGCFDVSVGPLVDLWAEAATRGRLPSAESLARVREVVGADRIRIREDGQVKLPVDGMSVDLGGIAKGWVLDQLARQLKEAGLESALLSFGQSSVWAIGNPPGERGWRLALKGPRGALVGLLTLRGEALSVSSSLGQASEIEGRLYGHVVDPRSGQALRHRLQVAVIAKNAEMAEAFSTALLVQDAAAGLALVESTPGVEALWVDAQGVQFASPGWTERTGFESADAFVAGHNSISRGSSTRRRKF